MFPENPRVSQLGGQCGAHTAYSPEYVLRPPPSWENPLSKTAPVRVETGLRDGDVVGARTGSSVEISGIHAISLSSLLFPPFQTAERVPTPEDRGGLIAAP